MVLSSSRASREGKNPCDSTIYGGHGGAKAGVEKHD